MQGKIQAPVKPITVTMQTAGQITGLGQTTLYQLIKDGKLKTTAVGGRRLVFYDSIEALVGQAAA